MPNNMLFINIKNFIILFYNIKTLKINIESYLKYSF